MFICQMIPDPADQGFQEPVSFHVTPELFLQGSAQQMLQAGITEKVGDLEQRLSQTESTIRPYFSVNTRSIREKLQKMTFPFIVKNWSRSVEDGRKALPVTNSNLPELYTPIVFSFAFVLVLSVINGVNGTFTFEKSSGMYLKFLAFLFGDVALAKLLLYIMAVPAPFPILTMIADLGSMAYYLTLESCLCWNKTLRFISLIYFGVCSVFWTTRTLSPRSTIQCPHRRGHTYSILGVALLQAIAPFFLVD